MEYEEGCTPTDCRILREANHKMAQELFDIKSKKWQGLTDEERKVMWMAADTKMEFAELIEAKLKEKNNG